MSTKINAIHLQRDAYVYIRQSTGHQVRAHPESQRRQYALADHARGLGFAHVIVIDEDVGRSGTGRHERPGFGQLLAAVCEGRVGAVFALEASRLARNNRDWHHLIDLCALTETLLIDDDGIYDPRQLNDRLGKRNKKVAIKPLLPVLTVMYLDIDSPTPHSPSWL